MDIVQNINFWLKGLEKQFESEHTWEQGEDGYINIFAFEEGYHNGPKCVVCGYSFCHHCSDGKVPVKECHVNS